MAHANVATSLQLARAAAIDKALARKGWTARRDSNAHPGAIVASAHTRHGIRVLILTLGHRHGQMVEIIAEATTGHRGEHSHRLRDRRPSWRMTAYNPPIEGVLAAAAAAFSDSPDPSPLETGGWMIKHAPACKVGRASLRVVGATRFIRPDGAVTATFHIPTYNPPCERCNHHGEVGDSGGWYIAGLRCTAEATAHTPTTVIAAFALALPGGTHSPATTPERPPVASGQPTKSASAAAAKCAARLTAVVC